MHVSDTATATIVGRNLSRVHSEIAAACHRAGRDPNGVTLIGVTKSVTRPVADALIAAGIHDIAENRVQDAVGKFGRRSLFPPLSADVRLHMIGNLQTNKARDVAGLFSMVHSVSRPAVAEALHRAALRHDVTLNILLEVNVAGEKSKEGADSAEVGGLLGYVSQYADHLHLRGLMTIAPAVPNPEDVRPVFRALRTLRDRLCAETSTPLPILSMGMSNDFPVAIEEGATHIRIGRALFVGLPSPG